LLVLIALLIIQCSATLKALTRLMPVKALA
jgi:hypothetical protein